MRLWRAAAGLGRVMEIGAWPWLDLVIRVQLAIWGVSLGLGEGMAPFGIEGSPGGSAAILILLASLLLSLGLATRMAALALLVLSFALGMPTLAQPLQLAGPILFGWYLVMGSDAVSLDRVIYRGVTDMPLPLASPFSRLCAGSTDYVGPLFRLLLRFAAAWALLQGVALDFMLADFGLVERIIAGLLVAGLFTRVASIPLILVALSAEAMGPAQQPYLEWAMLLGILLLRGPGGIALDRLIDGQVTRLLEAQKAALRAIRGRLPRVVIVGAGFAGLAAARKLADAPCRITLIDRRNYHLFQPLLYQVATATLSPADIAVPIRPLFRDQDNVRVRLGRVTDVDTKGHRVLIGGETVAYDYLVLATGARHNYFGNDAWEPCAPGLKKIDDATEMRRRFLLAFERGECSSDPEEQAAYLTFVIVGGGPTGVELAGAIGELAQHGMHGDFRNIDPRQARIILVQSAPRILPNFPEVLSQSTTRSLEQLGVEVRIDAKAETIDSGGVVVNGERIRARTVFWAAGVIASSAAKWLGTEADRAGRVRVGPDLGVPGHPEIFVAGDTAWSDSWDGKPMPGIAPAAKQGGDYVAEVIKARLGLRAAPPPFRYNHTGNLATIGRKAAVADLGWIRLSGALAWWFWGAVHVYFLTSGRNRLSVALEWFWAYLTFRRSTRLITGGEE